MTPSFREVQELDAALFAWRNLCARRYDGPDSGELSTERRCEQATRHVNIVIDFAGGQQHYMTAMTKRSKAVLGTWP